MFLTLSMLLQTLEVMQDDECQLLLTPQAFHNIRPETDLFNNINKQVSRIWNAVQDVSQ